MKKAKTKSVRSEARESKAAGGPRKCGVCGKRGHNKRSHENGRLKSDRLPKAR